MIEFGPFSPDAYNLNSAFAGEAKGVLPGANAYKPWPQMAVSSLAIAAAVRGAFAARTTANAIAIFAGTAVKLYKFAGVASAWTNVTRSSAVDYALATDDFWQFRQYGANVYGVNITDDVQFIDATTGTNFEPLTGSPPKARFIAVVGEHIMLAHTNAATVGTRQLHWCGQNAPTFWTPGTKRCDTQVFPDGGDIMGLVGGERGMVIFQTEAVRIGVSTPEKATFIFRKIEEQQGTRSPYSIVSHKGVAYYYGIDGWQAIAADGSSSDIGNNWLDDWFREISGAATRPKAIYGAMDPRKPRAFWLFASSGNATSTTLDRMLCYDPSLVGSKFGPWTWAEVPATIIFPAASTATSLENLGVAGLGYTSIDTLVPYSLDADIWKGGAPLLGAFDGANKLALFSGLPMAATVQTARFQPIPARRFYSNGFRPVTDAANAVGRVAVSERPQDIEAWLAPQGVTAQGVIHTRASGRWMRAEVTIPADEPWTALQGIDMDGDLLSADGER